MASLWNAANSTRIPPLVAAGAALVLVYFAFRRPYLFDSAHLAGALGLVLLGFIAAQYESHFWTALVAVFFWAGSELPLGAQMEMFRWVILGVAAIIAVGYYGRKSSVLRFNYFHLLGLFLVVAVFVSSLVSVNPLLTALKATSIAGLFIYGSIGVRILWARNPDPLVRKLCVLTEGLVYVTAVSYLFSFALWGNSNSLGLIMGVLCWPVLLWRFVLASNRNDRQRLALALLVCGILLLSSSSRASILAALLSSMFLLTGARRYRTLITGISVLSAFLVCAYLVAPKRFQTASDNLMYKKSERGRLMQSREEPWRKSIASFEKHPWLGSGFGVAENSRGWQAGFATESLSRERGSSYLTALEGTGLIGSVPLFLILLSLLHQSGKVFRYLRVTRNPNQPAVLATCIIVGGLSSAAFEDWLLAIGYYMAVIFWILALSLRDWMNCPAGPAPQPFPVRQPTPTPRHFALR